MKSEKLKVKSGKLLTVFFALSVLRFPLSVAFAFYVFHFPLSVVAQFAITQSAIANGGGQNSSGGQFVADGTAGQPVAGGPTARTDFALYTGFWNTGFLAPTAASVAVSGRVLTPNGGGLRNAIVTLTNSNGGVVSARSSSFGYYKFEDVAIGQTYIVNVNSKRFTFSPRVIAVADEITDLDLVAGIDN